MEEKTQTSIVEPVETPLTVKTKISCITCGRTNSSIYNYCTECGTALRIY